MKNSVKNIIMTAVFMIAIVSPITVIGIPQTAAAKTVAQCEARLLGIPPWFRGLTDPNSTSCATIAPSEIGGIGPFIWRIVLNVIEMAIVLTAYLTTFFILYGGFLYLTGGYNPAQVEKARKTILNAVIGLVISLAAIALTNLVFRIIT